MYRFYLAAVDMLPAFLILAPVFLLLNQLYYRNLQKSICYFLFSCYLSVVYVLVGMPNITYIRPEVNLNLVPVIGMINDWKNSILNVLLFIPMGAMLPVLWDKYSHLKNTLLFGCAVSFTIEFSQMLTFRATDVNDLITNTLGSVLGYLCMQFLVRKSVKLKRMANNGNTTELVFLLAVVLITMFFVYPFISSVLWDMILQ